MLGGGDGVYMWWGEAGCLAIALTILIGPFFFPSYYFSEHCKYGTRMQGIIRH